MALSSPLARVAVVLSLLPLVSCGKEEQPTGAGGDVEPLEGNQVLFVTPGQADASAIQDELARRDASFDGWDTEVLHDHAKHTLKDWMHELLDPEHASMETVLGHGSDAFVASAPLVRDGLQAARDAHGLVVRRAEAEPEERQDFATLCEAYRARLEGSAHAHADVKIFSVEPLGDEHYATKAYVSTLIEQPDGSQQQINHQWRLHWTGTPEVEHPKLREIETLAYEEIDTPRSILADLTEHVFGSFEHYQDEFLLGAGEWYRRKDRLTGNSYMGWQGLAIGDVNQDGYEDIYVCQPGGLANRLFLRQADGTVTETSVEAGVAFLDNTRGALLLDLDNDADQDLIVSMGPNLVVAYNDGTGKFGNMVPLNCRDTGFVHGISAADIDLDGDLDLYACGYNLAGESGALGGGMPVPYHDADNGGRNAMWRNDGPGQFTDVTDELGLNQNNSKFSLGALFEDFDADGDLDLYVTNDFGRNNYYRNDGGRFSDVAMEVGLGELAASMGASAADYDRDGDMDIYLSNMFSSAGLRIVTQADQWRPDERDQADSFLSHARGNFLLVNQGDGTFVDQTEVAGVELGRWAWGARFVDFDNDGFDDIYVPNGFVTGPDTGDL